MNKHLKQLIELSRLDKAIDDFIPEEERINRSLNQLFDEQRRSKAAIEEHESEIEEYRRRISKTEKELSEQSERLGMHSKKSGELKTEKELKAFSLEESLARERINSYNEDIAQFQKIVEGKKESIEKLQERISQIGLQIEEAQNVNADALAELAGRRQIVVAQKEELSAEIPEKVLSFYERIRRWAGSRTVSPVKKQACYGCFMKISDKVYSEVISSTEIVTCPSCGCILYIEE
ncbi:MAG: C4-type zinc ribbon domain-containing protein [Helicobacteraceae bacterium]|jgi:predicted  nucleic acid-binding Zn-ribbon protein|nr:C4-type zinc ribbon domain-containing protein [Helicobacteraceae bacterium]